MDRLQAMNVFVRVVETGSHADLMRAKGLYARLARAQDLDVLPAS